MKRKARERLPKRAAGAFPSYLYKPLIDLEQGWNDPGPYETELIELCHSIARKPLLLLNDEELGLTLRQRIGLPWIRTLTIMRLRQDPMRHGDVNEEGGVLRHALDLRAENWGEMAGELLAIADAIIPTLPETPDYLDLIRSRQRFTRVV